jgi:protein ImuA
MSDTAESIARLRASLAKTRQGTLEENARIPLGHKAADACLRGGLQRGTLNEVFAASGHESACTGFAAGLAALVAAKKSILWIRQDFSALEFGELSASGFLEFGLDPSRFLLLCVAQAEDAVRAASDALSCAALGAVVIEIPGEPKILDLVASRRLTLACTQKTVTAFLLRFGGKPQASTAETRWLVRSAPSPAKNEASKNEDWGHPVFETDLVRNRHGRTGHWVMEWNCDDGVFREHAPGRFAVVSASSDRPAAAALEGADVCRSVA